MAITSALEVKNAVKVYGVKPNGVTALNDVSITVDNNEFFTLLGPSGCGKTTLLRMIAGFETITDGSIRLFGENIENLPANKRPVNTVFQQYALFPHMTVLQNVAFGLTMLGKSDSVANSVANRMLDMVQLADFADRKPSQLSGGQQQRVALARALAPSPKLLLLDEPLSALDLKLRHSMRVELKQIQEEMGITFIFVTHDQEEALTMSDRIAVMSNGELQQVGTGKEIYEQPENRFVLEPENAAAVSNYAQYKAGVTGAEAFFEDTIKNSPELNAPEGTPDGTFVQACGQEAQALYDAVWTRLKK